MNKQLIVEFTTVNIVIVNATSVDLKKLTYATAMVVAKKRLQCVLVIKQKKRRLSLLFNFLYKLYTKVETYNMRIKYRLPYGLVNYY